MKHSKQSPLSSHCPPMDARIIEQHSAAAFHCCKKGSSVSGLSDMLHVWMTRDESGVLINSTFDVHLNMQYALKLYPRLSSQRYCCNRNRSSSGAVIVSCGGCGRGPGGGGHFFCNAMYVRTYVRPSVEDRAAGRRPSRASLCLPWPPPPHCLMHHAQITLGSSSNSCFFKGCSPLCGPPMLNVRHCALDSRDP